MCVRRALVLFVALAHGVGAASFPAQWKAARAGDPGAQFALAGMYATGTGTAASWEKARLWYERAADQGHVKAAVRMAEIYKLGRGVPVDHAAGARWLEVAAAAGDPYAQHQLGVAYYTGSGVKPDLYRANAWVRRAALQGYAKALTDLQVLAQRGEDDPVPPDPAARLRWMRDRAERGDPEVMQSLAVAYSDGVGTAPDPAEALRWFRKAAEAGQVNAQLDLGIRLVTGEGGATRDEAAGTRWLERAAAGGSPQARGLLRALRPPPKKEPRPRRKIRRQKTLDEVFAEMDARQRARDEYQASQRRAFNDYLDRTSSSFRWRYR